MHYSMIFLSFSPGLLVHLCPDQPEQRPDQPDQPEHQERPVFPESRSRQPRAPMHCQHRLQGHGRGVRRRDPKAARFRRHFRRCQTVRSSLSAQTL